MHTYRRILVSHDFGPGGEAAVASGLSLARRCKAQLRLVHVVEAYSVAQLFAHPFSARLTLDELVERAQTKLAVQVANTARVFPEVDYEVRTGKPFIELIGAGRAWSADLLVAGRSTEPDAAVLGSTAERLVRKSPVPVLLTRAPLKADAKMFLVPTDFSTCASLAAEAAIRLATAFEGRLLFVHILGRPQAYLADALGAEVVSQARVRIPGLDEFETVWDRFLAGLPLPENLPWAKRTVEGPTAPQIVYLAGTQAADMIIMGTHGTSELAQMLVGSVAEKVVRTASCPVLTVRPEEFQFVVP